MPMPKPMSAPVLRQAPGFTCKACGSQWLRIHNCGTGQVQTANAPSNSTPNSVAPNQVSGSVKRFNWPADSEDN